MSLPSTPAEAVTKAWRAISGLIRAAGRQLISEEEQVLFDNQDTSPRSRGQFSESILPGAGGNDGSGGSDDGSGSASSSDSSSSDSSNDSRSRWSHKRRKKRPAAVGMTVGGARGAGGTIRLLACWIWNLPTTTVPPLPGPARARLRPPNLLRTLQTQILGKGILFSRRRTLGPLQRRSIART